MPLRLYANSMSPFVRKVRITLYEKGVEFETVEIAHGSQRDHLLRINPRGEVPALEDGATIVTGSASICDYLEDRFPRPPLLPSGPPARARCRLLEHIADTYTDALQFLLFLLTVRRPDLREHYPSALPALAGEVTKHYRFLEQQLAGRNYFLDNLSRADVVFAPHLTSIVYLGQPIPEHCASLRDWLGRMMLRPSVQRDAEQALSAWEKTATNADPFFRSDRVHWRGERVEWAIRLGLGPWLVREAEAGYAYFSPPPEIRED